MAKKGKQLTTFMAATMMRHVRRELERVFEGVDEWAPLEEVERQKLLRAGEHDAIRRREANAKTHEQAKALRGQITEGGVRAEMRMRLGSMTGFPEDTFDVVLDVSVAPEVFDG